MEGLAQCLAHAGCSAEGHFLPITAYAHLPLPTPFFTHFLSFFSFLPSFFLSLLSFLPHSVEHYFESDPGIEEKAQLSRGTPQ